MAGKQLNTTTSSSQTTTATPQTAVGSSVGGSENSGSLQPGTSTDLLRSSNGIPLSTTNLPSVNLSANLSTSTASASPVVTSKHHINVAMLSLSAIFIIVAIILFFTANRSAKTTT
jgi:hypothetical protein